jgi:O-antigen/teichoic acid export membrane protein
MTVLAPPPGSRGMLASGAVSLTGSAVAAGAALVLAIVVGRGYGTAGTGLFFQSVALFTVLVGVLKLGTNSGLLRSLARSRALRSSTSETSVLWWATWPVLLLSAVVGGVLFVLADPLARVLDGGGQAEDLADVIRLAAPFVLVAPVLGVLHTGVRMMRGVAAFTVLQNVLVPLGRVGTVGVVVGLGWDVIGAFGAWLALLPLWLLVTLGVLVGPVRADLRARRAASGAETETFRSFWRFSGGRALGSAVEVTLEWADVIIVAAFRPAHEVGIYAVATRAVRPGQIVDRALRIVVSPVIAHQLAVDDRSAAASLHTSATRALVLLSWPFYVTLIVMGPAVLQLFGPGFAEGYPVLVVLAATFLVATLGGMLQSILLMGGRSSWQVYEKSVVLAASVALNLWLVPTFGVMGAAVTFAVVVTLDTLAAATIVQRGIGVELRPLRVLPAGMLPVTVFGGGGLVTLAVWGTGPVALLPYLAICLPVYGGALWLLRDRLGLEASMRRKLHDPAGGPSQTHQPGRGGAGPTRVGDEGVETGQDAPHSG